MLRRRGGCACVYGCGSSYGHGSGCGWGFAKEYWKLQRSSTAALAAEGGVPAAR